MMKQYRKTVFYLHDLNGLRILILKIKKIARIAADSPHLEKNRAYTLYCVSLFKIQIFDK